MIDVSLPKILIIAGDYEIITKVTQALDEGDFSVQNAYSYRDALYALEHENFNVVLVDSAMIERTSGEPVIKLLETFQAVPMVLLAYEGHLPPYAQPPVQIVLGALDKRTILRGVMSVLDITLVRGRAAPSSDAPLQQEIETVFALGKSLTEVLDLSEVLNRVAVAARYLTGAEEGMILLPDDDDAGQLYLRAKIGIDDEAAQNFRIKMEDTVAGRVFGTGEAQSIGAQGLQKVKTQYFVKALLYVPIMLQGRPIGVLGVNNKLADRVFEPKDEEVLANLASYAAIAIENARIHEETVQRARELQSLIEAGRVLNSSVSLDKTLPNICEQLVQVLNVNWSEILTWDREQRRLRTVARYQNSLWRQGPVMRLDQHPVYEAALREQRALFVNTADSAAPSEVAELRQAGAATMLIVPIMADQRPVGVLRSFFLTKPTGSFQADVLHRVQHLGLEALANSGTGSLNPRFVLRVMDEMNTLMNASWSDVALLTSQGQALMIQAAVGKGFWLQAPYPALHPAVQPLLLDVMEQQRPMTSADALEPLLKVSLSKRILALPLTQRGQAQGVVLFGDTRNSREFSPREIDLGKAVVGQAATALENASLVHDLERSLHDLQDAQDRLVETARLSAMGELAAAVAHQINNPLTTILVDTELMLLDEAPESRNYESLQAVSRAGKRAASVVRRLLATARPTAEDSPVEPIDVVDTIEGILALVTHHIQQDRIRILVELPSERPPEVWAVQGQLDDIWLNLLLNAHDALAGQENGQIGIRAEYVPADSVVQVVVWDNGPGIPPEIIPDIFKPFFTTKPVGEGTGLGLHICHQVIESVGGMITVESVPQQGARFIVRLPVKKG